jgi:hypothetical protein
MLKHRGPFDEVYGTEIIAQCSECLGDIDVCEDHEEVDGRMVHLNCLPTCEGCIEPVYDRHPDGHVTVEPGPVIGTFECITFQGVRTRHPKRDLTFAGHFHARCFVESFFPPEGV